MYITFELSSSSELSEPESSTITTGFLPFFVFAGFAGAGFAGGSGSGSGMRMSSSLRFNEATAAAGGGSGSGRPPLPLLVLAGTADLRVPAQREAERFVAAVCAGGGGANANNGLAECFLVEGAGHAGALDERVDLQAVRA